MDNPLIFFLVPAHPPSDLPAPPSPPPHCPVHINPDPNLKEDRLLVSFCLIRAGRELPRRSIIVCFLSLSVKAGLILPPFEISCSWPPPQGSASKWKEWKNVNTNVHTIIDGPNSVRNARWRGGLSFHQYIDESNVGLRFLFHAQLIRCVFIIHGNIPASIYWHNDNPLCHQAIQSEFGASIIQKL